MVQRYRNTTRLGQIDSVGTYVIFPSTNLVAYYKLDETTGTVADDAYGTNNGTASNVTRTTGKIANGASFNGSTSKILTNVFPSGSLTINAWIYINNTTGDKYITSDWSPSYRNLIFSVIGSALSVMGGNGLTLQGATLTGGTLSANTWYNVCVTRNGGVIILYINGTQVATQTIAYSGGATSNLKYIGIDATSYAPVAFNGLIDEVGIWNRALTQDEITALYNGGNGMTY